MEKHKGCIRGYYRNSKSYYSSPSDPIDVDFGMFHPEGGTSGVMTIEWVKLGGELCAKLKVFEDSWGVLTLFTDVIHRMGQVDDQLIQEADFCKILDDCGFKDLTKYKDPHGVEMVTVELPREKAEQLGLINKQ